MSVRHLIRAGSAGNITMEVAAGRAPTGEDGVLLIRRHPTEPLSLTFLTFADAWDLVLSLRQILPDRLEIGRGPGQGYAALDDPPKGSRPARDTGIPVKECLPRATGRLECSATSATP